MVKKIEKLIDFFFFVKVEGTEEIDKTHIVLSLPNIIVPVYHLIGIWAFLCCFIISDVLNILDKIKCHLKCVIECKKLYFFLLVEIF